MLRIAFAWILGLVLTACGGGGGGTSTPAPFAGTYRLASYQSSTGSTVAAWGTASADGAGNFTVTGSRLDPMSNPTVSSTPVTTYEVTLGTNNQIELAFAGQVLLRGGLSANRDVGVLASVADGADPSIVVLVRATSGASPATFSGAYWASAFVSFSAQGSVSDLGNADGGGLFTSLQVVNVNGNTGGSPTNVTHGYTVGPTGESTLFLPNQIYQGGITGDGEFAMWSGNSAPPPGPAFPLLRVAIRGGTTTAATFAGTYHVVTLEIDLANGNRLVSSTGTAAVDGAGNMIIDATLNTDGQTSIGSTAASYSVDSNNVVTLNRLSLTENIGGALTQDGRFAVLSGGNVSNSNPIMMVFVRQ